MGNRTLGAATEDLRLVDILGRISCAGLTLRLGHWEMLPINGPPGRIVRVDSLQRVLRVPAGWERVNDVAIHRGRLRDAAGTGHWEDLTWRAGNNLGLKPAMRRALSSMHLPGDVRRDGAQRRDLHMAQRGVTDWTALQR